MAYEEYRRSLKCRPPTPRPERLRKTAAVLGLSKRARLRLEWMIYFEGRGRRGAIRTARYFGIGVSTFHKWRGLFDDTNLRSLESRSRAPKTRRGRACTPERDQEVINLRKQYPYWGKMKLKVMYESRHGEEISSWYVQRVLEHYGLNHSKQMKKKGKNKRKTQVKKRISECARVPETGFLLHLDSIVLYLEGVKRYIITATDDHSKIAYARMYTSHASSAAKDFFERMHYLLGDVRNVHTDNGSEFHKHFDSHLKDLKLPHFWSRARTPKDNPSNERFNRTLKEEFLIWGNFRKDPDEFNRKLTEWLVEYNAIRPHQSLNYMTPLKFAQKTGGLSTMWSSSTLS